MRIVKTSILKIRTDRAIFRVCFSFAIIRSKLKYYVGTCLNAFINNSIEMINNGLAEQKRGFF